MEPFLIAIPTVWAVVCFGLIPLPWYLLIRRYRLSEKSLEDQLDAGCLAYAFSFCLLYLVSLVRLDLYWLAWGAGLLGALVTRGSLSPPRPTVPDPYRRYLGIAFASYFVIRLVPVFFQRIPQGWDTYFHLVLADRIVATGKIIHDWMPFEPIALNYPLGSHLLLALLARLTALPTHRLFQLAIVVFTTLSGLQTYSLVSRATNRPELALYSATSFAFLAIMGSLGYFFWGGLPNLCAVYLMLGLLSALEDRQRWRSWADYLCFAILFVGACLVHHHVMVALFCVVAWVACYLAYFQRDFRAAGGLAAAVALGAPYFLWYALRARGLGETGLGGFSEETKTLDWFVSGLGHAFFFSGAIGFFFFRRSREKYAASASFRQSLIALIACFVLAEVGGRLITFIVLHRARALFTPSRFLTDAVPLLSIFPGTFWLEMREQLSKTSAQIVTAIALCFTLHLPLLLSSFQRLHSDAYLQACDWIKHHTAPNTVFLDRDIAASYLTDRLTPSLPIPTSEPTGRAVNRKQAEKVLDGQLDAHRLGRPVVAVVTADDSRYAKHRTLWSHPSGLRVVEIVPPAVANGSP